MQGNLWNRDHKSNIGRVLNFRKPGFLVFVAVLIVVSLWVRLANPSSTLFNGATYRVSEVLYDAAMYSFIYSVDTAPQYSISSDFVLFSKQKTEQDWTMHGGLSPYKISKQELYTLFIVFNNQVREVLDQTTLIYRADTDDELHTFHLVIQLKNGEVLLAVGYDREDNRHIRCLFKLERISDDNGFSLSDQEVGSMLGYSPPSVYCFSSYTFYDANGQQID